MKAQDVIKQLQAVLPNVTDLFTQSVAVSSLSYVGGVVTAVTSTPHLLSTGDYANVVGATNPIGVTSMTRSGTVITVETDGDHDLTLGPVDIKNGGKTVQMTGATEAEFNGAFNLLDVLNRRKFQLETTDAGPTVATGAPLVQNASAAPGYNGRWPVTVIDPTTFTYPVSQVLFPSAGGSPVLKTEARVSGAISVDRAEAMYTKQGAEELWAFVVLGDVLASKDRNVRSDLTATVTRSTGWNQRISQPFTVYVFVPTTGDTSGRLARDQIEDVAIALFRSLLGVKFDTYLAAGDQYSATFVNHGFSSYNSAYYIHEFNFEIAADITFGDTVGYDFDTAFRDINIGIVPDFGTQEDPATVTIDLDKEPLP